MACPRRVKINGEWYDAGGYMNRELFKPFSSTTYKMDEPFVHMNNFVYVYNQSGTKIGEIDGSNRRYSGAVQDYEM